MTVVMSYKLGSKSAKTLARSLGVRRVRANGDFRNNYNHRVINWGSSQLPTFPLTRGIINHPSAVALAVNKRKSLITLRNAGVPVPVFHTDIESAAEASDEGKVLFARMSLTSNSGRGIVVVQPEDDLPEAPLYTEFFDKVKEYRVHVGGGQIFDFQAKLKRNGAENPDPYIYNYALGGRVFCRGGVEISDRVRQASIAAVEALGLDFGAVDIGEDAEGNVAVFEVNCAPSLEGQTLTNYIEMLGRLNIV